MSAGWAGVFGRTAGAGVLLAASASFAADSTPPATPLENAKRDYAEIKKPGVRAGTELEISKDILPSISVDLPDALSVLPPNSANSPTRRQAEKLKARREKSANWLLEAMRQPASANARRKTGRVTDSPLDPTDLTGDDIAASESEWLDGTPVTAGEGRAEREAKPEIEEKAAPANPLEAFMASWMTPRDFELLASAAKTSSAPASDAPRGVIGFAPSPVAETNGVFATANPAAAGGLASEIKRESLPNPYLAPLESSLAGLAPPPNFAPVNLPTASPSIAAPALPPAPRGEASAPVQTPPPSELLRGSDDAKYFKQLKRF